MEKIKISEMNYDTAITDREHVLNLQYPVLQRDLDALCKRLPRFYNSMGELYLAKQLDLPL